MSKDQFKQKRNELLEIAAKYKWTYYNSDENNYRVSFVDELLIYRVDIYVSKMTVCFIQAGYKNVYLKHQSLEMIKTIFQHPYIYKYRK